MSASTRKSRLVKPMKSIRKGDALRTTPSIGLLPLYLQLYDKSLPEMRGVLEPFLTKVIDRMRASDLDVIPAPFSCVSSEIGLAVDLFQKHDVDLIITLHLAYSPSLEAIGPLVSSRRPILMLDTTLDEQFGLEIDPIRLLYNHGIHGVQDLASLLHRHEIVPFVVAGHLSNPRVMKRVVQVAQAALAAKRFTRTRALRIGPVFPGMGDFQVDESVLEDDLGFTVEEIDPEHLLEDVNNVSETDIDQEMQWDREHFRVEADPEVHRRTNHLGLGLRRFLERGRFDAFSLNFLSFNYPDGPLGTVPFLECSKATARGVGYAGEGDVLTAALVGALQKAFGETTFTEMFCPDWEGGTLFLSHMGEINPEISSATPRLYEKDFSFTQTQNPAVLTCAIRSGEATLVNLAPGPNNQFNLIAAPVDVIGDGSHPDMENWIRGWIRPDVKLEQFLEIYSEEFGGTHHNALMMGNHLKSLEAFARMTGMRFCPIPSGVKEQ